MSAPQPEPSPFDRLLHDLDKGRRGVGRLVRRDPQAILGFVGVALASLGVSLIVLAWSGAAHSRYVQQQLSYLVSGGLVGLALVVIGGFLYVGYLLVRHQRAVMLLLRAQMQTSAANDAGAVANDAAAVTRNDAAAVAGNGAAAPPEVGAPRRPGTVPAAAGERRRAATGKGTHDAFN